LKDISNMVVSLLLFIMEIIILWYKVLVTEDIPIKFSLNDLRGLIIVILIYMAIQYIHINRIKSIYVNFINFALLLYPATFWYILLKSSLYFFRLNKYNIICNIAGFISMIIILSYNLFIIISEYRKMKKKQSQ
jgi:hypothetical protein